MDIIKVLHEIAQNEHENFQAFKERLTDYCTNRENGVITLFRLLKGIEHELDECLIGKKVNVNVERRIIIKVLKTIRIEIDIIRFRIQRPELFEQETKKTLQPAGKWTSKKIDLIELIFAIKMSVNKGRVSIKALQECFEYIFQIELGNIDDRLQEIKARKGNKTQYLESLIKNLNKVYDELTQNTKLKWTGGIVDWVEFIYAFHAVGYANDGKVSLTELFQEMGEVFDIEVKEFSRTFINIKNRSKGDRTKFLDTLKRELLRKIEEADGKTPRK